MGQLLEERSLGGREEVVIESSGLGESVLAYKEAMKVNYGAHVL